MSDEQDTRFPGGREPNERSPQPTSPGKQADFEFPAGPPAGDAEVPVGSPDEKGESGADKFTPTKGA